MRMNFNEAKYRKSQDGEQSIGHNCKSDANDTREHAPGLQKTSENFSEPCRESDWQKKGMTGKQEIVLFIT